MKQGRHAAVKSQKPKVSSRQSADGRQKTRAKSNEQMLAGIAKNIKLLILDVDGVLTDGRIILDNEGNEFKAFHVRDGHGIRLLISAGVQVALITGRESKIVQRRAHELGITEVFQKCYKKIEAYEHLLQKLGVSGAETAYVGDDVVDLAIMDRVALPVAVADAAEEALQAAKLVTSKSGGKGAVREVCDLILKAQGRWEGLLDGYRQA